MLVSLHFSVSFSFCLQEALQAEEEARQHEVQRSELLARKRAELPDEPAAGVTIRIQFPDGTKITRIFEPLASLEVQLRKETRRKTKEEELERKGRNKREKQEEWRRRKGGGG